MTTHVSVDPVAHDVPRPLAPKEEAALLLFATGSTRAQIAARLALSESTVGHLLTSAKEKLGARTLPHAVHLFAGRVVEGERTS